MLVGIDIGGTFTDFAVSENGGLRVHKVFSTPCDPAQAVLSGLDGVTDGDRGVVERVSHGSTVATNAILERRGARAALITTGGFRDILAIGRQTRPELYALQPRAPRPLIPRRWCYDVPERVDSQGRVVMELDLAALDAVLDDIERQGIESIAVSFLHSYVNPVHERAVRRRIRERGLLEGWQIALSSDVLPQFREVERTSTVALEAYVRPVVHRYLRRLEEELPKASVLRVMKSDGGVVSASRARQQAVHTALSGPAAGVIGGFRLAQLAGYDHVITLDMGGTSTDVALCPGKLVQGSQSGIDGLPLSTRLLDIETIGAGGGSVARLDAGGILRVGPESAGADPGPIAYGRGGREVTVTDAHVVLGRVDPGHFLGGATELELGPTRRALRALGSQMGMTAEEAALGVIEVANAGVDRALRRVSIARGYDPRDFTLLAFGGAGPLHACAVAEQLEIPRVVVPPHPGVLCALGLLLADVVLERSRTVLAPLAEAASDHLQWELDEMGAQARRDLMAEGVEEEAIILARLVDVRYRGQSYEMTIPFEDDLAAAFHAAHAATYGHAMTARQVEVVNLRVRATGLVDQPAMSPETVEGTTGVEARIGDKVCVVSGLGAMGVSLYERERFSPGAAFAGPALVFQMDSTVFIPPSWSAQVDGYRNLVLQRL